MRSGRQLARWGFDRSIPSLVSASALSVGVLVVGPMITRPLTVGSEAAALAFSRQALAVAAFFAALVLVSYLALAGPVRPGPGSTA